MAEFVALMQTYSCLDAIVAARRQRGGDEDPFLDAVLAHTTVNFGYFELPQRLISTWQLLENALAKSAIGLEDDESRDTYAALLTRSQSKYDLCKELQGRGFEEAHAGLYLAIVCKVVACPDEFRSWCVSQLNQLDSDVWEKAFRDESSIVGLAIQTSLQSESTASPSYVDGLRRFLVQVAAGEATCGERFRSGGGRWLDNIGDENAEKRRLFRRDLLADVIALERSLEVSREFLESFGREIGDAIVLVEQSRAVDGLFRRILLTSSAHGLNWLLSIVPAIQENRRDFEAQEGFEDFVERTRNLAKNPEAPEVQERCIELLEALELASDVDANPEQQHIEPPSGQGMSAENGT